MQSFLVYTFTFFLMYKCATCICNNKTLVFKDIKFRNWSLILILLFTIIFGIRYNVGIDYKNYKEHYDTLNFERMEYIFRYISMFLAENRIHITAFFSLWAFTQISFLIASFKNEKYLYPALIFILFAGQYFLLWMNVIRQDIAACIFIYSISFIVDKKLFKYILCIVIACGFHKTALLLLLIYPIWAFKKSYFSNIPFQILLLFVSAFIGVKSKSLFDSLDVLLVTFMTNLGYENYAFGILDSTMSDVKLGMSFLSSFFIDVIVIAYSNKTKQFYNNNRYLCFYDLYFIGVISHLLLAQSFILLRPFRYFRFFKMIICAYLLYYLYNNRISKLNLVSFIIILLLFLILYIAIFRYSEDACYNYLFYWQS